MNQYIKGYALEKIALCLLIGLTGGLLTMFSWVVLKKTGLMPTIFLGGFLGGFMIALVIQTLSTLRSLSIINHLEKTLNLSRKYLFQTVFEKRAKLNYGMNANDIRTARAAAKTKRLRQRATSPY